MACRRRTFTNGQGARLVRLYTNAAVVETACFQAGDFASVGVSFFSKGPKGNNRLGQ